MSERDGRAQATSLMRHVSYNLAGAKEPCWCTRCNEIADALAAAFRSGAEQMRERCATLAEDWSVAQGIEASDAPDIATAIRTLPVEEPRPTSAAGAEGPG